MPIKTSQPLSYTSYYVEKRKTKRVFLQQIGALIDWEAVTNVLEKHYPTGPVRAREKSLPSLGTLQDDASTDLVQSQ